MTLSLLLTIVASVALLLSLSVWFLIIYVTVKFYQAYKQIQLAFDKDNLDSPEST